MCIGLLTKGELHLPLSELRSCKIHETGVELLAGFVLVFGACSAGTQIPVTGKGGSILVQAS